MCSKWRTRTTAGSRSPRRAWIVRCGASAISGASSANRSRSLLKEPFQARKKFAGELQARESGWGLVLPAAPISKTQAKAGAKADVEQVLDFTLDELQEARLVPVIDFKGRRRKAEPAAVPEAGAQSDDGGQEE